MLLRHRTHAIPYALDPDFSFYPFGPPTDRPDESAFAGLDRGDDAEPPNSSDAGSEADECYDPEPSRPAMRMTQAAYRAVMAHLTSVAPEAGGMLLGPKGSSLVTHYVPDHKGRATPVSFTVDAKSLNVVLKQYLECDLDAKGLVHSHPAGCNHPSAGDHRYVRRAFANDKNQGLTEFYLPIVCGSELFPYLISISDLDTIQTADLVLI